MQSVDDKGCTRTDVIRNRNDETPEDDYLVAVEWAIGNIRKDVHREHEAYNDWTKRNRLAEQAKREKIEAVIIGISKAAGVSRHTARHAIEKAIGHPQSVGAKLVKAIESSIDAVDNLGKAFSRMNPLALIIEQNKTDERERQKANKGYYNQLLYYMEISYVYPVKTSSAFTNLFHRQCSMRLKTFSNLRF